MSKMHYAVGDKVVLRDSAIGNIRAKGVYLILAVLPESAGAIQYRVRSEAEGFDRRVSADEIDIEKSAPGRTMAKAASGPATSGEPWFKASSIKVKK